MKVRVAHCFKHTVQTPLLGTYFIPRNANMDYGEQSFRQAIVGTLSPPDVSPETLNEAVNRILELYPDNPALGSPFNTGNETFGLPQGYKRWAAFCKCFPILWLSQGL